VATGRSRSAPRTSTTSSWISSGRSCCSEATHLYPPDARPCPYQLEQRRSVVEFSVPPSDASLRNPGSSP
jgi:hypothetical protein